MQQLVTDSHPHLFSLETLMDSWKLTATTCSRLSGVKNILISVTNVVEQAEKVTGRILNLVETESQLVGLYLDNAKKHEQLLLDVEEFVRLGTQAIFRDPKEDLSSQSTRLLGHLADILRTFEEAIPQRNENQSEGEVAIQQGARLVMDNIALPIAHLTAEGRVVAKREKIYPQREVGDKTASAFSQAENVTIVNSRINIVTGDYTTSNRREAPGLDFGQDVGDLDVIKRREFQLIREIYKGRTYRLHTAELSGRFVAVQVYAGQSAKKNLAEAAKFYQTTMHPNIPLLFGVSPSESESSFLLFNETFEGTLAHVLGQALKHEELNQSLALGVQTVMSFASGIDYLQEQNFPFNSMELDDFVPMVSYGKIMIAFDHKQIRQGSINETETEDASKIFDSLCQKTFDSARKAHYENEHINSTPFDGEHMSDEDDSGDEFAEDDTVKYPEEQITDPVLDPPRTLSPTAEASSSIGTLKSSLLAVMEKLSRTRIMASPSPAPSASLISPETLAQSRKRRSRTSVQKKLVTRKRHELTWRPASEQTPLADVSEKFQQLFMAFSSPSSSESEAGASLRHRRYPARTSHKCREYKLVEINLTTDIKRSVIITYTAPTTHEICHVCGQVVKAELNCECGNNGMSSKFNSHVVEKQTIEADNQSIAIIKCANCSDWHHRSCIGLVGDGGLSYFVCRRCKEPLSSVKIRLASQDPRIGHNSPADKDQPMNQDREGQPHSSSPAPLELYAESKSTSSVPSPSPGGPFKPRLFALIIGINRYKDKALRDLRGAEPDALAFKSYFENDLQVPADRIKVLLSERATRSNVIEAFREIAANPSIQMGDAIAIFYAGIAGEFENHLGKPGTKTPGLVPCDYSSSPEQPVSHISNQLIEKLIGNIAVNKGDNITVILDCCSAGSATRASTEGLKSHMLLAACGASEIAREINGRGVFSVALLKLLSTYSSDQLRYCDILTHMDVIHGQNPQCEGRNQHRMLFSTEVAPPIRSFPVKFMASSRQECIVSVDAGSAQGVAVGAKFSLYAANDFRLKERLAFATVKSAASFTATLDGLPHDFDVRAQACVAIQTKAGQKEDLRLFVPPGDAFNAMIKSIIDVQNNFKYDLHNIALVADQTIAHLKATLEGPNVLFEVIDERVTRYGSTQLFELVDAHDSDQMGWTFSRIAHFYRELNRTESDPRLTSHVHIEFYELEQNDDEGFEAVGVNLYQNGTIDIVVNDDILYGVKLVNESQYDLYPYLFWFDNNDLSIKDCYLSPGFSNASYKQDIPLPRRGGETNGELTIGYSSNNGYRPFCFCFKAKQHLDVNFFKLFVSTKPIDLSYIPQSSPFDIHRGMPQYRPKPKADRWEAILIPVVQRREPLSNWNQG